LKFVEEGIQATSPFKKRADNKLPHSNKPLPMPLSRLCKKKKFAFSKKIHYIRTRSKTQSSFDFTSFKNDPHSAP
jgi:hypothetical protein